MRYYTFSLSLACFGSYLQRVTTRYCQIYKKKMDINIFLKILTVTRGNPLQIAPKLCQTERKCAKALVVTC